MLRATAPAAGRLDRRLATLLRQRRYDAAQVRAFLAITPAAASRLRSLPQFLEQVEYNGRRLAKLNVPPAAVNEVLREFGGLLDPVLAGHFEPAREQLQLATVLILNDAFYQVREAECQAFFGLYHAETEAAGLEAPPDRPHPHAGIPSERRPPLPARPARNWKTLAPALHRARPAR
jgi:hypothetical protein